MEETYVLIAIAEMDLPDSEDIRKSSEKGGYEFLGRGSIFEIKGENKIEIFDSTHKSRYFYKVLHKNLKFFKAAFYKLLPPGAYVHATMLDPEDIDLDNKDLEARIKKEMVESRKILKKSSKYTSI